MTLRISGKQMEIGDAFRERIDDRIQLAVDKYFDGGFSGHVTVEKTGSRFTADCLVRLDTGVTLQATGQAQEPQSAFDAAADRIEKRLRRYKRRLKSHDNGPDPMADFDAAETMDYRVMAPVADEDSEVPEDYAPAIVAETTMSLRTMSVASAVIELDMKDSPVFVFRNAGSSNVNIVYRRADGNIGWIDPSSIGSDRQAS
ncbi:MAG: ribosome hibernation-promoting factor, HPF/YfiA family [Aliihoeflea sp.]